MDTNLKVTLASCLDVSEFPAVGAFEHTKVLDLRCQQDGSARPIEEAVLKRLRNHFVDYEQLPMVMDEVGPCQDVHLCEVVRESEGRVLVLTDAIAAVATLLNLFKIPFESNVFYVVETGSGNIVRKLPDAEYRSEDEAASVVLSA